MRADSLLLYNTTQGDIKIHGSTLHLITNHPCALGYGWRLGTITSNKGKELRQWINKKKRLPHS